MIIFFALLGWVSVSKDEVKLIDRLKRKAHQSARRETFIPHIGILYERICRSFSGIGFFQLT